MPLPPIFRNKNALKAPNRGDSRKGYQLVRMRSPVQIWVAAPNIPPTLDATSRKARGIGLCGVFEGQNFISQTTDVKTDSLATGRIRTCNIESSKRAPPRGTLFQGQSGDIIMRSLLKDPRQNVRPDFSLYKAASVNAQSCKVPSARFENGLI